MVAAAGGKEIQCSEYGTFGSKELSLNILKSLGAERRACLLANHGMICYGPNLKKTLWLANEIETLARQYIYSCCLGPPKLLSDNEMTVILAKFKTYGKQASEIEKMDTCISCHAVKPPTKKTGYIYS